MFWVVQVEEEEPLLAERPMRGAVRLVGPGEQISLLSQPSVATSPQLWPVFSRDLSPSFPSSCPCGRAGPSPPLCKAERR